MEFDSIALAKMEGFIVKHLTILIFIIFIGCQENVDNQSDTTLNKDTIPSKQDSMSSKLFTEKERRIDHIFNLKVTDVLATVDENRDFHQQFWLEQAFNEEYHDDLRHLDSINNRKDKEGLLAALEDLPAKWKSRSVESFLAVCEKIRTSELFTDEEQIELLYKYTSAGLAVIEPIPIEYEMRLMMYADTNIDYLKKNYRSEEFKRQRMNYARQWLQTGQSWQQAIDEEFDFSDLPERNVEPPPMPDYQLPPGITPDAIEDPVLRKEYERTIEKNAIKTRNYNKQVTLRRDNENFLNALKRNIVHIFSLPPSETEKLRPLLDEYIMDDDFKADILRRIKT